MIAFIIFLNTANNRVTQRQGQKAFAHYTQGLFALTAPGQVLVSEDWDTPLSWVRHMERHKRHVGLDARTHDPEWTGWTGCGRLLPNMTFPSRKMVECLVSVMVCKQQHRKSKCSIFLCQLAVTSFSLAFLTTQLFLPSPLELPATLLCRAV